LAWMSSGMDAIDYDVAPRRAPSFYAAIRTYWPDLLEGALQPGYAGVRPKIARRGCSTTDSSCRLKRIMASQG
jgi:hypothetical protein